MSLDSAPAASIVDASAAPRPAVRRKSPITAHPRFPAFLALWLAAVLGLSSLVIAPAMLERIVAASRIETFVAAAAPPLGQTARLLLTLGLTGLGGLVGLILGRALAPRSRRPAAAPLATEHDEADALPLSDAPAEPAGLRERLARLTGQGDGPRDFDDLPRLRSRDRHPDAPGCKPICDEDGAAAEELANQAAAAEAAALAVPAPALTNPDEEIAELAESAPEEAPAEPLASEPLTEETAAILSAAVEQPAEPIETPAPSPVPAAVAALKSASLDSLGVVQLTERLAISMRERRERDASRAEERASAGLAEEPSLAMPPLALLHRMRETLAGPGEGAAPDAQALRTGYSSLLDLTRKADPPHQRPPLAQVVPGPFSAPARFAVNEPDRAPTMPSGTGPDSRDPAENYRALKAALASLQQISGTR